MAERNGQRLKMTLKGDGFKDGKVPLTIVAAKLQALQNLLFHGAATVAHDVGSRRGQWYNKYREIVELHFVSSHHSDLVIEAELPSADPTLFQQAAQTLDFVFDVASAIDSDAKALAQLLPDRQQRALMLRAIGDLSPDTADEYQVELANCSSRHPQLRFTGRTRQIVRRLAMPEVELPSTQPETVLVGTLTKIHVDIAPLKIAVRVAAGTEIDCYYDESMRDQIANLLAGSIVEVTGVGSLDWDGRVKQIDAVNGVETVSMEPLRMTQFEHEGTRYKLREPLVVSVEYVDGLWVYSHAGLNLWGYAPRREDALRDLAANFHYIWQEFALEDDSVLDAKSQAIKHKLLGLVENSAGRSN